MVCVQLAGARVEIRVALLELVADQPAQPRATLRDPVLQCLAASRSGQDLIDDRAHLAARHEPVVGEARGQREQAGDFERAGHEVVDRDRPAVPRVRGGWLARSRSGIRSGDDWFVFLGHKRPMLTELVLGPHCKNHPR